MTTLIKFFQRLFKLAGYIYFHSLANGCADFVTINGGDDNNEKQYPINKLFAKRLLLIVATGGPMTLYQLAGIVGVTSGGYKFNYTVKELKRIGAFRVYGKRDKTEYLCVKDFTEPYVALSTEDLRAAVFKARSSKKNLNDVTEFECLGPPLPFDGQTQINPM